MSTQRTFKIEELTVVVSQDDIVKRIEQVKPNDMFGEEVPNLFGFLDFEHAQPYIKEHVTQEKWDQTHKGGDETLRELINHYHDWWKQKIEDGRGISVHRGRGQMVNLLFLAGIEGWEVLRDMDGGWYQQDAYNWTGKLFRWEYIVGGINS